MAEAHLAPRTSMMRSTVLAGLGHEGWFEDLLLFPTNKFWGEHI
jgi:hypothetical protein